MRKFAVVAAVLALCCLNPVSGQTAAECKTWLNAPTAYSKYEDILAALRGGKSPASIANLKCLVPGSYSLTTNSAKAVYKKVIQTSFHPSILYYATKRSFENILEDDAADNGHMILAWPGSYVAEAALTGYQKTGQTRFLDAFVSYFDRVIARRDDRAKKFDVYHKRVMKAWGATELGPWVAFPTPNGRIVYPATLFARIVRETPALTAKYGATAARYIRISEQTLAEFDGDWKKVAGTTSNEFWYHVPYEAKAFPLRRDPTNHVHLIANAWLNLHKLTDNAKYKIRVETALRIFFKSVVKVADGTVYWNYFPYFAKKEKTVFSLGKHTSEYMWKVSLTTPFLLRAKADGYTMPPYLMRAITKTLTTVNFRETKLLKNLSPIDNRGYLNPSTDPPEMLSQARNVVTLVEWAPVMKNEVSTLVANRPDLFPRAWMTSTGLLTYARFLPNSN